MHTHTRKELFELRIPEWLRTCQSTVDRHVPLLALRIVASEGLRASPSKTPLVMLDYPREPPITRGVNMPVE